MHLCTPNLNFSMHPLSWWSTQWLSEECSRRFHDVTKIKNDRWSKLLTLSLSLLFIKSKWTAFIWMPKRAQTNSPSSMLRWAVACSDLQICADEQIMNSFDTLLPKLLLSFWFLDLNVIISVMKKLLTCSMSFYKLLFVYRYLCPWCTSCNSRNVIIWHWLSCANLDETNFDAK